MIAGMNLAVVIGHNPSHDRQPQAGPGLFWKIGHKEFVLILGAMPVPSSATVTTARRCLVSYRVVIHNRPF